MARSKQKLQTAVVVGAASLFCVGFVFGLIAIWREGPKQVAPNQMDEAMTGPRRSMDLTPLAERKVAPDGILALYIERFRVRMKRYPATLDELLRPPPDLSDGEFWDGPYVANEGILDDPWDQRLRYACPGVHNTASYDLWSVGRDGIDDTFDDVANW